MERKTACWSFGAIVGAMIAATIQVVLGVVFAAQANATFAEFLSLFRGESFAANVVAFAAVGVAVMEGRRRRDSKATGSPSEPSTTGGAVT